jgi:hypothetical protein
MLSEYSVVENENIAMNEKHITAAGDILLFVR